MFVCVSHPFLLLIQMTRPNVTVAFPFPFHKVTAAFFSPSSVPDDFSNRPCVPPLLPLTTAVGVEREEGRGKNLGKCCSPNNSRAQHSTLLLSPPILRPHTFTMFYSFSFTYFSLIFSILIFNHKLKFYWRNVYIYGHLFLWQHSALFIILTIQSHGGIYLRALEEYTQVNKCARGRGDFLLQPHLCLQSARLTHLFISIPPIKFEFCSWWRRRADLCLLF